ncbi:MAG: nucleotidyltransferase family protein [Proteobacteria bacterium]|nr:nucleotidyltransferase family protein [Pseudomonadota bacterium]
MKRWAWQPTPHEERVLAAALGPADDAAAAYAQWRAAQAVTDIDEGTLRLLPLLMRRQALWADDGEVATVIRGTYRRAFFRGQMLQKRAAQALALLRGRGLATMLLKGGALLPYYDGNVALRPMNDFDVLVHYGDAQAAIDVLVDAGWTPAFPRPARLPEVYHGACFTSADGLDFDLHWQPLPSAPIAADDWSWTAAQSAVLDGEPTATPCAADLLTIVCAHAVPWMPTSPVRWVADALLIAGDGRAIDWERVYESARTWHVAAPVGDMLAYLATRWSVDVPAALLRGLACVPTTAIDRAAYQGLGRAPDLAGYVARPWRRYRVRARDRSALAALPGFVEYLQITLGCERATQLPAEALRRIFRFRQRRRGAATA